MNSTPTGVIILNYRGEMVLGRCLESVFLTISSEDRVLVVDNGGETEFLSGLQRRFPRLEVLSLPQNIGFAAGMNAGIRFFAPDEKLAAYWLLNNDTVVAANTLAFLKEIAQEKGKALFSPLIRSYPQRDKIWFAGGSIDFFRMKVQHHHALSRDSEPFQSEFLTGCALFITREAQLSLGFLDERYFLYAEDAEYSLRAKRQGIARYVVPKAVVYHSEESEMSEGKTYWLIRSAAEFFLRETKGWQRSVVLLYYSLRRLKNWLKIVFFRGKYPLAREIERAYTDVSP